MRNTEEMEHKEPEVQKEEKPKKPQGLTHVRHVRVYIARVLRAIEAHGDLGEPSHARAALHGAQVLIKAIELVAIEDKIRQLAEQMARMSCMTRTREQEMQARLDQALLRLQLYAPAEDRKEIEAETVPADVLPSPEWSDS